MRTICIIHGVDVYKAAKQVADATDTTVVACVLSPEHILSVKWEWLPFYGSGDNSNYIDANHARSIVQTLDYNNPPKGMTVAQYIEMFFVECHCILNSHGQWLRSQEYWIYNSMPLVPMVKRSMPVVQITPTVV